MHKILTIVSFALILLTSNAFAYPYQTQQFKSTATQVTLVELFTSEGCNSCPPAEHWINNLKTKKNLWTEFVPVAFHVDYWDYLGWKDVYAKPEYTQRQRFYAAENRETVYTPGVRAEGREWRHWRRADLERLSEIDRQSIGVLDLNIADDGTFKATFDLHQGKTLNDLAIKGEPYFLTVALLGMGISTEVKRGENAGRTLDHDFIVLNSQDYEIKKGAWQGKLPTSKHKASEYSLAAWVSSNKSLTPIQVVGGALK